MEERGEKMIDQGMRLRRLLAVSTALGALCAGTAALADPAASAAAPAAPPPAQGTQQDQTGGATANQGQGSANSDDQEIIITGLRREERLSQAPQSISVVGQDTLERQRAVSLPDYQSLIPGLDVQQSTPGEARVVLRGVNTGSVGSTVAIYVDDTPFGSSSSLGNAAVLAGDFDTFDLARIEVLRGPQGTLYGSNALGGVLRFVTNAPEFDHFEARAQAGIDGVDGGGTGWLGNAMVNVPLGSTLAFRASGFYRRDPGFIDATGRTGHDINNDDVYGGRASLLFKPTSALSVRLTAIAQNVRANSPTSYDADPQTLQPIANDPFTGAALNGRLTRAEFFPDRNNVNYRLYNGTVDYDLGPATLTSVTSYGTLDQAEHIDGTLQLGGLISLLYPVPPGPKGVYLEEFINQKKFTQEVRLASHKGTVEWLVGGYYTHEKVDLRQRYQPFQVGSEQLVDPALAGQPQLIQLFLKSKYEEIAGFANLTWHVTSRLELSAGGRYSHNSQSSEQNEAGALLLLEGLSTPIDIIGRSKESVFTWSLNARYEFSPHTSIYARVAKGYRPGGPNVVPPGAQPGFPTTFKADTIISYEAGLRTETADRKFAFDGALFYLDWRNILVFGQFNSAIGPVGANDNGGRARSQGAEATITLRPTHGFRVLFIGAYTDAKLRDSTPPITGGLAGDQLPFTPKFSGTVSADYDWRIAGDTHAFVGADAHMVSRQPADFDLTYRTTFGHPLELPSYTVVDLRAGLEFRHFSIEAFVRNLGNSRALTNAGGFGTRPGTDVAASPSAPRTIGATLFANF